MKPYNMYIMDENDVKDLGTNLGNIAMGPSTVRPLLSRNPYWNGNNNLKFEPIAQLWKQQAAPIFFQLKLDELTTHSSVGVNH